MGFIDKLSKYKFLKVQIGDLFFECECEKDMDINDLEMLSILVVLVTKDPQSVFTFEKKKEPELTFIKCEIIKPLGIFDEFKRKAFCAGYVLQVPKQLIGYAKRILRKMKVNNEHVEVALFHIKNLNLLTYSGVQSKLSTASMKNMYDGYLFRKGRSKLFFFKTFYKSNPDSQAYEMKFWLNVLGVILSAYLWWFEFRVEGVELTAMLIVVGLVVFINYKSHAEDLYSTFYKVVIKEKEGKVQYIKDGDKVVNKTLDNLDKK